MPYINETLANNVRKPSDHSVKTCVLSTRLDVRCVTRCRRHSAGLFARERYSGIRRRDEGAGRLSVVDRMLAFNGIHMSKDVVYSLKCAVCGEEYVSETERTVRKRSKEHRGQAKNAT